jgi:hypothetical protein
MSEKAMLRLGLVILTFVKADCDQAVWEPKRKKKLDKPNRKVLFHMAISSLES